MNDKERYTRMCLTVHSYIYPYALGIISKKDAVSNTFHCIEELLNTKSGFICSEFVEQYMGEPELKDVTKALGLYIENEMKKDVPIETAS